MSRVLIACEESQAVTKEMRLLGIEAYSCDIEPCSGGHPEWHIQGDVIPLLAQEWDMIIAFPPCTHLCVSGAKHFSKKQADGRQQQGVDFFMMIANTNCHKIAIENSIGIMSSLWRKPNQIIQPYEYGDAVKKSTCLWLKGLPNLIPTNDVSKDVKYYIDNKGKKHSEWNTRQLIIDGKKYGYHTDEFKKHRSTTFPGIAKAMATQWGVLIK